MNIVLIERWLLILICNLFITAVDSTHAETSVAIGNVQKSENAAPYMYTTWAILQHNERLLNGTTIGEALKASTNQEAIRLFNDAQNLFKEASEAHQSGKNVLAKELSLRSIITFYKSDRIHYNLPGLVVGISK